MEELGRASDQATNVKEIDIASVIHVFLDLFPDSAGRGGGERGGRKASIDLDLSNDL